MLGDISYDEATLKSEGKSSIYSLVLMILLLSLQTGPGNQREDIWKITP